MASEEQIISFEKEIERGKTSKSLLNKLEPQPEKLTLGLRKWRRYNGNRAQIGTDQDPWAYSLKHMQQFEVTPQTTCRELYEIFDRGPYSVGSPLFRLAIDDPDDSSHIFLPRDSDLPLSQFPIRCSSHGNGYLDVDPSCYHPSSDTSAASSWSFWSWFGW